jgi:hypothetical protein
VDRLALPQVLAQAREELLREERLREVVVGPRLEPRELVLQLVERGDHEDRRVGGRVVGLDAPADLVPVHAGEADVEEDDVGPQVPRLLERLRAVLGHVDLEPLGLQLLTQDPAQEVGVVHDEDGGLRGRGGRNGAHEGAGIVGTRPRGVKKPAFQRQTYSAPETATAQRATSRIRAGP